jgi:Holliday junction resolvase
MLRPSVGRASRAKGLRREREATKTLREAGLDEATKISRSGYSGSDLSVPCACLGRPLTIEVKSRSTGQKQIREWLGQADVLIIHVDRHPALAILSLRLGATILAAAERSQR